MQAPSSFSRSLLRSLAGLAAVGVMLGGLAFANTDALLERGFERAIARSAPSPDAAPGVETASGTEDFWLRKPLGDGPIVPVSVKQIAVGDRVTVNSGGAARVLEVVAVNAMRAGLARAVFGGHANGLAVVTCRDTAQGQDGPLVRFVFDAAEWPAVFAAASPRAL